MNHPSWATPDDLYGNSTWYQWVAPAEVGPTYFELEATDGSNECRPALGVYTGADLTSEVEIAYNLWAPKYEKYDAYARVELQPVAGTTYMIGVGSHDQCPVALTWGTPGTPPANDDFANAAALADDAGSTAWATFETGEPTGHWPSWVGNLSDLGGRSVWYVYTPATSSTVEISLEGSDYDTVLGVYTGSLGSLTAVAFNDDSVGVDSFVRFDATAGVTYFVGIGGYYGYYQDGGQVMRWGFSGAYVLDITAGIPLVTAQPASQNVLSGAEASFSATASGDPAPTVQWQVSTAGGGGTFVDIPGATDATYSIASVNPTMNGNQYRAVFTNTQGTGTTNAATLTVEWAPAVTTHPSSQPVASGSGVSFSAAASANPASTVQWQRSTDGGSTFDDITGATDTTYTITSVDTTMSGYQYRAAFTNSRGTGTTDAATLTVTAGPATVTDLVAQFSQGKITVTFNGAGDPAPTQYRCTLNTKRSSGPVSCQSGDVFKSSAKSVTVEAYNTAGWGPTNTVNVTRAPR